jgi:hypothetical protein
MGDGNDVAAPLAGAGAGASPATTSIPNLFLDSALALDAGADSFLSKPFTIDAVLQFVTQQIRRSHSRW